MKLICQDNHRNYLLEKLKGYHHLDIVLVEKGIEYEGICYSFSIANLDHLIYYLSELNDKHVIGYIDNKQYKIKPEDIVYIEGFSKEAYIQCFDKQYETSLKLYELEGKVLIQQGLIDRQKTEIEKLDEKFGIKIISTVRGEGYTIKNNEY